MLSWVLAIQNEFKYIFGKIKLGLYTIKLLHNNTYEHTNESIVNQIFVWNLNWEENQRRHIHTACVIQD